MDNNIPEECINTACTADWKPIKHWTTTHCSDENMAAQISYMHSLMPSQSIEDLEARKALLDKNKA